MKAYKDIYLIYVTLVIVGSAGFGYLTQIAWDKLPFLIAGFIVWVLANYFIWNAISNSRTKKYRSLYDKCDMNAYINQYKELEEKLPKRVDDVSKNDVKIALAEGLYAKGEYKEAINKLDEVHLRDRTGKKDMAQDIRYNSDMALCLIEKGDLDAAETRLNRCYKLMDSVRLGEPIRSELTQICDSAMEYLNMKEGNLEGMEEKFTSWSETSRNPVAALAAKFRLAEIFWAKGKQEEAMAAFRDVAEKGGDTFYAARSKEIVNRKGKQSVKISIPMAE